MTHDMDKDLVEALASYEADYPSNDYYEPDPDMQRDLQMEWEWEAMSLEEKEEERRRERAGWDAIKARIEALS